MRQRGDSKCEFDGNPTREITLGGADLSAFALTPALSQRERGFGFFSLWERVGPVLSPSASSGQACRRDGGEGLAFV